MPFVYLLHFDTPLSHAYHYGGATDNLKARLLRHAQGHGSAITRALIAKGIEWIVAALWLCDEGQAFAAEKVLKRGHQQGRFCPVCRADPHILPGATAVEPELYLTALTSLEIRQLCQSTKS